MFFLGVRPLLQKVFHENKEIKFVLVTKLFNIYEESEGIRLSSHLLKVYLYSPNIYNLLL